jgi:hypothetical protein
MGVSFICIVMMMPQPLQLQSAVSDKPVQTPRAFLEIDHQSGMKYRASSRQAIAPHLFLPVRKQPGSVANFFSGRASNFLTVPEVYS